MGGDLAHTSFGQRMRTLRSDVFHHHTVRLVEYLAACDGVGVRYDLPHAQHNCGWDRCSDKRITHV